MIKFAIRGNLRFLSHAETLRLFQRACVRAGIEIQYSQGFNPRPKLSLPLPKSVGIEVNDDLLCLIVPAGQADIAGLLVARLPEGISLISADISESKSMPQPCTARYEFKVGDDCPEEKLRTVINDLLVRKDINLQRKNAKDRIRNLDVRHFLQDIKLEDKTITVECNISPAGSIRVDEILLLLELDIEKLTGPVRRIDVQWRIN